MITVVRMEEIEIQEREGKTDFWFRSSFLDTAHGPGADASLVLIHVVIQ